MITLRHDIGSSCSFEKIAVSQLLNSVGRSHHMQQGIVVAFQDRAEFEIYSKMLPVLY